MMTPEQVHTLVIHMLTQYDRKQAGKRNYNPYALAHYCRAAQEIEQDMHDGLPMRKAIVGHLCGRLLDLALKAVGESKSTNEEQRMKLFV